MHIHIQIIKMLQQRQILTAQKIFKNHRYPVLNVCLSSRVLNQRVNNLRPALTKYKNKIKIQNGQVSYQNQIVDSQNIIKFQNEDGMIYDFKDMVNLNFNEGNHNCNGMKQQNNITIQSKKGLKILICVCMYNQSMDAINLTLEGIYNNLKNFQKENLSANDIAVVLVQDGILKLVQNRTNRTYAKGKKSMVQFYMRLDKAENRKRCILKERINVILDETENYVRNGMKQQVPANRQIPPSIEKNVALVYQNIWWPSKTKTVKQEDKKNQKWGLRVFSCFKHTNGTKLSSHLLFFQGFCRYLNPQFCVLLDVGTTPDSTGLVNLIKGFGQSPNVGGVSGFMNVDPDFQSEEGGNDGEAKQKKGCCNSISNFFRNAFYSVQKAQQYEYIISHFLDKNQQSALGFLHVLPGAWSAYRYDALIKSDKYEPNLLQKSYFKMILNPNLEEKDYQQANMYLAQDRILSLGIYCQIQSKYILRYVPNAVAYTDPMKDHENLMNQRRRWINSSLFAFLYAYKNYYYNVMDSRHNCIRQFVTLNLSMLIALLSSFNAYVTPGIYFFVLYATIYQLGFYGSEWVAKGVCFIYVMVFFTAVGGALTGRSWSKHAHIISVVLAFFTFGLTALLIYNLIFVYLKVTDNPLYAYKPNQTKFTFDLSGNNKVLLLVLAMLVSNIFCYWFVVLMHLPTHPKAVLKIFLDMPSYLAYNGAYSQTMVIHAFCNVDDVSWGTKGSTGSGKNKFQEDKVYFVGTWIFVNAVLAFIFMYIDIISNQNGVHEKGDVVLVALAVYGTVFLLIKCLFAIYHHFKWLFCLKCCLTLNNTDRKPIVDSYWKKIDQKWNGDNHISLNLKP